MSALYVQDRPEGLTGPFCEQHRHMLSDDGGIRPLTGADVAAYGDAVKDCHWCANPARYEPPVVASLDGRCATCTWWGRPHESGGELYRGRRVCRLTVVGDHGRTPDHPDSKALAADAESYYAELWTAPDFSCNQYQRKDP